MADFYCFRTNNSNFESLVVYEFKVEMTCEGCSGAVERVLDKLKGHGVDNIHIDLPAQRVTVTATITADEVLEQIKKSGKETLYIGCLN